MDFSLQDDLGYLYNLWTSFALSSMASTGSFKWILMCLLQNNLGPIYNPRTKFFLVASGVSVKCVWELIVICSSRSVFWSSFTSHEERARKKETPQRMMVLIIFEFSVSEHDKWLVRIQPCIYSANAFISIQGRKTPTFNFPSLHVISSINHYICSKILANYCFLILACLKIYGY